METEGMKVIGGSMAQANSCMEINSFGSEDTGFDTELYARDPFFNRATQAEIQRRIADIEINGDAVLVDFDPTEQN